MASLLAPIHGTPYVGGAAPAILYVTAAGLQAAVKCHFSAAVAPAVTDDSSAGYAVGSWWFDTTADKVYVCVDSSVGAAVWIEAGGAGGLASHAALTTGVHGLGTASQQDVGYFALAGHNHAGVYDPAGTAASAVGVHAALTTGVHGLGTASQQDVGYFALAGHDHTGVYQPVGPYLTSVTAHDLLSSTHGDTAAGAVVRGDLVTGQGATPKWTRLAKGAAGQLVTCDANDVVYTTATYPPTTTANHVLYSTATNVVGSNAGLTFDGNSLLPSNVVVSPSALGAEKITNGSFAGQSSTGWTLGSGWSLGYAFTVSGITTSPATSSTYTNNGVTFTTRYTRITGTAPNRSGFVVMTGSGAPLSSGTLSKASGTGDSSVAFSAVASEIVFHIATGTSEVTQTSAAMATPLVAGEWYTFQFDVVNASSAAFTLTVTCGGKTLLVASQNGTHKVQFRASSTANMSFAPSSAGRFGIDNISLKKSDGVIDGSAMLLEGTNGATPAAGAGNRLMWIPEKAAFRAGQVDGDQWDDVNVGYASFAVGGSAKASGSYSVAMGNSTVAAGTASIALGTSSIANFEYSLALGLSCEANNISAVAVGNGSIAYGYGSVAVGGSVVYGQYATSAGSNTINVGGTTSTAIGYGCVVGVDGDSSFGFGCTAIGFSSSAIAEQYSLAVGYTCVASGNYSTAIGSNLIASGIGTTCLGGGYSEGTDSSLNWGYGGRHFQLLPTEASFGSVASPSDYTSNFLASSHSGQFKWMADEDYFAFTDDVMIPAGESVYFRDSSIYISSLADGYLDYRADTGHRFVDGSGRAITGIDQYGNITIDDLGTFGSRYLRIKSYAGNYLDVIHSGAGSTSAIYDLYVTGGGDSPAHTFRFNGGAGGNVFSIPYGGDVIGTFSWLLGGSSSTVGYKLGYNTTSTIAQFGRNLSGAGDVFINIASSQVPQLSFSIDDVDWTTFDKYAQWLIVASAADKIPLTIKLATSQTANGFELKDSSSSVLAYLDKLGGAVFNETGHADADFRVESDTEPNMFLVDSNGDTDGAAYLGGTTNGIKVVKGGALTLLGTAKRERHIQIDAKVDGGVANQPTPVDFFTAGGLQFGTTGSKYAYCQWEVPDDWDGSDVYLEIDWFPDSGATSGTDAVRWKVEYRAIAEGETINNGTSVTLDNGAGGDTADYAQYTVKHTRFTIAFNNANQPLTKQDHVFFKVSRDTGVANDFGGSVTVTAYEIIYTSNGFPTSN